MRTGVRRRRWRRRLRAVVDVAERAKQAIRLLGVDLPLREKTQDLLALFGRHQRDFRAASRAAAASSTPSSPFASFSRTPLICSRAATSAVEAGRSAAIAGSAFIAGS